jgi:hypothetical protein
MKKRVGISMFRIGDIVRTSDYHISQHKEFANLQRIGEVISNEVAGKYIVKFGDTYKHVCVSCLELVEKNKSASEMIVDEGCMCDGFVRLNIPIELFADMVRWCPGSDNKTRLVRILKEQELSHDLEYKLKDFLEGYRI